MFLIIRKIGGWSVIMFPLGISLSYMLTNMLSTKEVLLYYTILAGLVICACKKFEGIVLRNIFTVLKDHS